MHAVSQEQVTCLSLMPHPAASKAAMVMAVRAQRGETGARRKNEKRLGRGVVVIY